MQDWKRRISETTVPWLEIRGKHFAFTVQKDRVLDNLESISSTLQEVGKEWDEAIEEFFFEYYGLKIDKDAEEKGACSGVSFSGCVGCTSFGKPSICVIVTMQ